MSEAGCSKSNCAREPLSKVSGPCRQRSLSPLKRVDILQAKPLHDGFTLQNSGRYGDDYRSGLGCLACSPGTAAASAAILRLPPCYLGANMAKAKQPTDIDAYIASFPADVQAILEQVRATIRRAAPQATEKISYQMPAFKQHGILIYFAAWKKHIGLYPPVSGDPALEKAIAPYAGEKGNLQFPLDQPIPYALIARIVKHRVQQDTAKAAAKRKVKK